jgi:hypothetical protein
MWAFCRPCGAQFPARCGANACRWCGPVNALQTARAIALAEPERSYLLTLAGESFGDVRGKVKRVRYRLRERYPGWSDCWHVEPNPSGDGQHHVHGLQHGTGRVDVEILRSAAVREGFGRWVGLRRVRRADAAAMYGVKLAALSAAAYSLKGVGADLETFLEANGGRMVHASRGFWREGGDGGALPGVRVARRVAGMRVKGAAGLCPATGESHDWDVAMVGVPIGRY